MRPPATRWYAPLLDLACLLAFVGGGRENHNLHGGPSWFLEILWPFALAFGVGAVLTRLYRSPTGVWGRLLLTDAITIAGALVLRSVVYDRTLITTFAIVASAFIVATTFGWRIVAVLVTAFRARAWS